MKLNREEWLKARKKGIGGSDASIVAGLNPWKTPAELFYEKRDEILWPDLSDNAAVHWGIKLEDLVAQEYAEKTGNKVHRRNDIIQHQNHEWMLANIDRRVVGQRKGLECKTSGAYVSGWGQDGTDDVPVYYLLQCMHYMEVLDYDAWDLAVLIGGRDFRIYHLERDEDLIDDLVDIESNFWGMVQEGTRPELDHRTESTTDLLKRLHPGTNGEKILLGPELYDWHLTKLAADARIKEDKKIVAEAKSHILEGVGEASIGHFEDGTGYTRKEITVNRKASEASSSTRMDFRFKKKAA